MKNFLFFALMVFLDTMMFGQTTGITAFVEPNDLTIETNKYLQDSIEWHNAYKARLAAITIYPNPTRGEIHISGLENKENELWVLQLMDCDGRLIYSSKLDPNERNIDLPEVGIGLYVIRLMNGNTAYPFRITVFN